MSLPILDLYDDPSAAVLRNHLGRVDGRLPDKLASFHPQEPEVLAQVPDRLFALVGHYGGEKLRKYAMHDPEHLATSILYFLELGGTLPAETRTKVAMNLISACGWYETPPPVALTKVAFVGAALNTGLTAMSVPGKLRQSRAKNMESDTALRAAQMSGVKQAQRPVNITNGDADEACRALDRFLRGEGEKTTEDLYADYGDGYPNPFADPKHLIDKSANLIGTEAGAQGALSSDPRSKTPQRRFASAPKVASWLSAGELHFEQPSAPIQEPQHFAMPHQRLYPIDTPEQVKRASAYFNEYGRDFTLDDRRVFAQSVATRAEELGVPVSGTLRKLAGNEYGPHIVNELKGRINALEGTGKEAAYEVLLEHLDETPPIVMYDILKMADEETGIDNGYGRPVTGMKDPLSAVFGAPERPIYSWVGKGCYVTEEILRSYTKLVPDLDKVIEKDWSVKFIDDPIAAFEKLPDAKKIIVARLANGEAFRWI